MPWLHARYRTISGKADISLAEVLEEEPLEDIEQLANAVLTQVPRVCGGSGSVGNFQAIRKFVDISAVIRTKTLSDY